MLKRENLLNVDRWTEGQTAVKWSLCVSPLMQEAQKNKQGFHLTAETFKSPQMWTLAEGIKFS